MIQTESTGKSQDDNKLGGLVRGLHHITLVTSNEEVNRRFYTEILGLRRVKLTVNQDDPLHRHLFYADEKGTTGSAITFFEWPDLLRGYQGLGSPHHLSYNVRTVGALPKWKAWLASHGVPVLGPIARGVDSDRRFSLYLRDPDGVVVEIISEESEGATQDYLREEARLEEDIKQITSEMKLTVFNHASPITSDPDLTSRFLTKFVGLRRSFVRPNPDQEGSAILAMGNDERADFLRYLSSSRAAEGVVGIGNIHHIAMSVEEDEDQLKIMHRLNEMGMENSGIVDRFWFKSLYFRDPDGNLLEIATKKPGYTSDEPLEKLGSNLVLPSWLEPRRQSIERALSATDSTNKHSWPPASFPELVSPPERVPQVGDEQLRIQ
ncbi:MAG TPA: VOC family protein [Nitrososphaerales archaeon]|nr:VOC family protein [Nitrososphaerales archaeon]